MSRSLRRALLLLAFDLLYHQFAWAYDAISAVVSLGRWHEWGATALPFLTRPRVLELGHGPGHLLAALAEGGWRAVGLDLSPQMGRLARRRLARRGLAAPLVRGRGQTLPFPDNSFNSVVAVFPAPYIIAPETVAAIQRVLRPDGRLVIVPEAELTRAGPAARAIEWLYQITGQRGARDGDSDTDRNDFWKTALSPAGFQVQVQQVSLSDSLVTVVVAELLTERPNSS
jgi:ubiquinone/menaquinone biosynthesis C-methylase UbiE